MAKTLEFITKRMDQKKAAIAKKEAALDKKLAAYEKHWKVLADNGVSVKNDNVAKFEKFMADLRVCDDDDQLKSLLEYGKAESLLVRWDCRDTDDNKAYGIEDDYEYSRRFGGWGGMDKKQQAVCKALENLGSLMKSRSDSCSILGIARDLAELRRDLRVISAEHSSVLERDMSIPEILKDLERSISDTLFQCDCEHRAYCAENLPRLQQKLEDLRNDPLFNKADSYWYYRSEDEKVRDLGERLHSLRKSLDSYRYWISRTDEDIRRDADRASHDLVINLFFRIKQFCGEVTSWENVQVTRGARGSMVLNGVVDGTSGKCEVRSIEAGGYNIQPWHIRVLTLPIR